MYGLQLQSPQPKMLHHKWKNYDITWAKLFKITLFASFLLQDIPLLFQPHMTGDAASTFRHELNTYGLYSGRAKFSSSNSNYYRLNIIKCKSTLIMHTIFIGADHPCNLQEFSSFIWEFGSYVYFNQLW